MFTPSLIRNGSSVELQLSLSLTHLSDCLLAFFHSFIFCSFLHPSHLSFELKWCELCLFLSLCLSFCPLYSIGLSPSRYLLSRQVGDEYVTLVWAATRALLWAIQHHFEWWRVKTFNATEGRLNTYSWLCTAEITFSSHSVRDCCSVPRGHTSFSCVMLKSDPSFLRYHVTNWFLPLAQTVILRTTKKDQWCIVFRQVWAKFDQLCPIHGGWTDGQRLILWPTLDILLHNWQLIN